MRLRGLLWFNAVFCIMPVALLAIAIVEGRVELPKSHSAPVQAKRYEIVTKGGVLSTQPPLAVVYLDGVFPSPASPATKEVAQKDLTFVSALLPIQAGTKVEFPNLDDTYHTSFPTPLPNDLTLAVIVLRNVLSRYKFSTNRAWSRCGATFTITCAD